MPSMASFAGHLELANLCWAALGAGGPGSAENGIRPVDRAKCQVGESLCFALRRFLGADQWQWLLVTASETRTRKHFVFAICVFGRKACYKVIFFNATTTTTWLTLFMALSCYLPAEILSAPDYAVLRLHCSSLPQLQC